MLRARSCPALLAFVLGSPAAAFAQSGPGPEGAPPSAPDDTAVDESAAARAPSRPVRGFEYGLRSGVALPFGEVESGRSLGDDVDYRIPVWVDIGYRLNPALYLALYGQIGLYGAGGKCASRVGGRDVECNAEDVRLGFEGLLSVPVGSLDVWVGAGIGWEWLEQSARFAQGEPTPDSGPLTEFVKLSEAQQGPSLELQAGLDFSVHGALEVGPFVGYTVGTFIKRSCSASVFMGEAEGCRASSDRAAGVHHWATLGLRGTYGP